MNVNTDTMVITRRLLHHAKTWSAKWSKLSDAHHVKRLRTMFFAVRPMCLINITNRGTRLLFVINHVKRLHTFTTMRPKCLNHVNNRAKSKSKLLLNNNIKSKLRNKDARTKFHLPNCTIINKVTKLVAMTAMMKKLLASSSSLCPSSPDPVTLKNTSRGHS